MKYVMSESEALFLKNKFGFSKLLGLNENQMIQPEAEDALRERNVIYSYGGHDELQAVYRLLFATWQKARYSVTRPELNNGEYFQCLLVNDDSCIFFARKGSEITIDLFDFSEQILDMLVRAFTEVPDIAHTDVQFNLTMTLEDYRQLCACTTDEEFCVWQNKLGIRASVLQEYIGTVQVEDQLCLLLVEDHVDDCGYLAKLATDGKTVYALKHVTKGDNQKMVLAMGNTQSIVDSIYNF